MEYIDGRKLNDKEFIRFFEKRVQKTLSDIKLDKKQKILVAASGGKDSTSLLFLMKKLGYDIEAITVNAHIGCYSENNLKRLKEFCSKNKIKVHEISLRKEFGCSVCHIISILDSKHMNKTNCSVCGALRRYLLNKYARKLKADVILTGHNLDDEANGILLALFSGNLNHVARTSPIIEKESFVRKAKPLYFLFENEVERYSKLNKFDVDYGWCPCSSKGQRKFIAELDINDEKKFNLVKNFIFYNKKLRNHFKQRRILLKCRVCKEPSSNELCQACKIMTLVKR